MEISYKSKPDEYTPAAERIAKDLRKWHDKKDFARFGSGIILSNMSGIIFRLIHLTDAPWDDIISHKENLGQWCNMRPMCDAMRIVMEKSIDIDYGVMLSEDYISKPIERFTEDIHRDLYLYLSWLIQYGCDAPSKRRYLNARQTKQITDGVKRHGHDAINTLLLRSLVMSIKLIDKVFIPKYTEMSTGVDNTKINTFAGAFRRAV